MSNNRVHDTVWCQLHETIYILHTTGDPLAGRVELVSAGVFRRLGYKADEFTKDAGLWYRIMHPDDVPRVVEQTQEIFRLREPRTRTYRLRHAVSGEYRWIEDSAVPLSDEQGDLIGIAGVARDVTALKQTEHELEERRIQLETLIDALPDGVVVVDNSGLILQSNAQLEQMLGWKSQELVGQTVEVLLPERFRGGHTRLRSQYAEAPGIRPGGLLALHREGKEVPVDIMLGSLPGAAGNHVLVTVRDMTAHRKAEQGLAYLSSIVKSADDSIVGTDLDGVIESWNRGAEGLFGYTEEEALGKHLVILFPPDLQNECLDNLERIGHREQPSRYESRRERKDGSKFDVSVIVSPIKDSHGKLLGMSSICRDITERKRVDAALQVAKRATDMASQSKSDFLTAMSYELRTPLNCIISLTDVVLESELTREQREHLTIVKDCAHSQLTTLSDILDIVNIQSGKYVLQPRQFWLREFVDTTMKEFEAAAQAKNLQLTWHIQPNLPPALMGALICLRQILSRLVDNAIKFTAAGEVTVTVEAPPQDPSMLSFSVRDTGIAVSVDQQQVIFEPFAQMDNSLRRKFGGTGLGLTTCAKLAEIMGGRIWVDSDGHTGSTFHFTVRLEPVHTTPENTATQPGVQPTPSERRALRRAVDYPAQMRILRPFSPLPLGVRILDVSKGGLKVRASQALDPGALVQINLKHMVLVAEVRYCIPAGDQFHVGVEFVHSDTPQAHAASG